MSAAENENGAKDTAKLSSQPGSILTAGRKSVKPTLSGSPSQKGSATASKRQSMAPARKSVVPSVVAAQIAAAKEEFERKKLERNVVKGTGLKAFKKTYCSAGEEGYPAVTDYSAEEERELFERETQGIQAGSEYSSRITEKAAVNILKPIHQWTEEDRESDEHVVDYIEREALMVERSPYDDEEEKEVIGLVYVIPHPDTSLIDVALRAEADKLAKEEDAISLSSHYYPVSDPGVKDAFEYYDEHHRGFIDGVGEKHYRYMCDQLDVMPSAHFIKSLTTDTVSFRFYGLNPRSMRPICEALYNNIFVKYLDLENNWLTEDSAYHLAELMKENNTIMYMNLAGCRLGATSAWKIAEGLSNNRTIIDLNLSGNEFGDEGAKALLVGIMENSTICKLDLSHNNLGRESGVLLGQVFSDQFALRELDLSWNKLYYRDGFKKLMNGLKLNVSIITLNLSGNALNIENAKALRPFLAENETVKNLDLSFNRFNDAALGVLKRGMMKNKTLRYLRMGHNPVTYEAPKDFLQALKKPTCDLALLDLEDVWVDKAFVELENKIAAERDFMTIKAGVIGNYVIKGPNPTTLMLQRARFEGLSPKKKKKKKDFGVFLLKLPPKPMLPKVFDAQFKAEKLKIRDELMELIKKEFTNPKKKVDIEAMTQAYMELFPETRIPEPKKKKAKKKKKGKKDKKGKKAEKAEKEKEEGKPEGEKEGEKEGEGKEDKKDIASKESRDSKKSVELKEQKKEDEVVGEKEIKEYEPPDKLKAKKRVTIRKSKLEPLTKAEKEKLPVIPWETMLPVVPPEPVYVPEITQLTQAKEIEEAEMRRRTSTQRASSAPIPEAKIQEVLEREAERERQRIRAEQPAPVNKAIDALVAKAALGKRYSEVDTTVTDMMTSAVEGKTAGRGRGARGARGARTTRGGPAGRGK